MDVSLEVVYREACLALGEEIIRGRLLEAEARRLTALLESSGPEQT